MSDDELLARLADRAAPLSPEDVDAARTLFARDPEVANRLAAWWRLDDQMSRCLDPGRRAFPEHLRTVARDAGSGADSVERKRVPTAIGTAARRRPNQRAQRWKPRLAWMATLAACLVAASVLWHAHGAPTSGTSIIDATVTADSGWIERGAARMPLAASRPQALLVGDLLVANGSVLAVRYADGTAVDLSGDGLLGIRSGGRDEQKQLRVVQGVVTASVAKQPAGLPMRFITPQAEAVVLGTRLKLALSAGATRLDVIEGSVGLYRSAGQHVTVNAGEFAVAQDGVELEAQPIETAPTATQAKPVAHPESETALWSDGFEDLTAWGREPFGNENGDWPSLALEPERDSVRTGMQALRVRYRMPDAAGSFTANYRSLARTIHVPAEATRLRMWVRRISAAPGAQLFMRLRNTESIWEQSVHVEQLADGWQPVDMDFAHPQSYWRFGMNDTQRVDCPPVDTASITHLVLVADNGDFDVVIDDIELSAAASETDR